MLRPGGRLAIADIVSATPLKESTRRNTELWAACIAGAIPTTAYLDALVAAGFAIAATRPNDYRFLSERAREACSDVRRREHEHRCNPRHTTRGGIR